MAFASAPSASSATVLDICRIRREPDRPLSLQTALGGSGECRSLTGFRPLSRTVRTVFSSDVRILIHSTASAAFTTKGNVDAERAKKCLSPTQVAGEGRGVWGSRCGRLSDNFRGSTVGRCSGFTPCRMPRVRVKPHARSSASCRLDRQAGRQWRYLRRCPPSGGPCG